jgi:hypothetical protein
VIVNATRSLFDIGIENLVVQERGRLRFEEETGSLLFDHLVVLSRPRYDAELEVGPCPCPLGDEPQAACLGGLV